MPEATSREHTSHEAPEAETLRDIPLMRRGAGTSWQPDLIPSSMLHAEVAGWRLMFQGLLFLVLPEEQEESVLGVGSLVLGYVYNFGPLGPVRPGVGVRGAVNGGPKGLEPFYGSRTPVGGMVYVRLSPAGGYRWGVALREAPASGAPPGHPCMTSPGPGNRR